MTILLVIHLLIALTMVGVVLLQRSEGGALGIGGGGGGGGFMSGRASANMLTRITAGLAAAFMITSLLLTILATRDRAPSSILKGVETPVAPIEEPAEPTGPSVPVAE